MPNLYRGTVYVDLSGGPQCSTVHLLVTKLHDPSVIEIVAVSQARTPLRSALPFIDDIKSRLSFATECKPRSTPLLLDYLTNTVPCHPLASI